MLNFKSKICGIQSKKDFNKAAKQGFCNSTSKIRQNVYDLNIPALLLNPASSFSLSPDPNLQPPVVSFYNNFNETSGLGSIETPC
jgi:hypothetical protein